MQAAPGWKIVKSKRRKSHSSRILPKWSGGTPLSSTLPTPLPSRWGPGFRCHLSGGRGPQRPGGFSVTRRPPSDWREVPLTGFAPRAVRDHAAGACVCTNPRQRSGRRKWKGCCLAGVAGSQAALWLGGGDHLQPAWLFPESGGICHPKDQSLRVAVSIQFSENPGAGRNGFSG